MLAVFLFIYFYFNKIIIHFYTYLLRNEDSPFRYSFYLNDLAKQQKVALKSMQ